MKTRDSDRSVPSLDLKDNGIDSKVSQADTLVKKIDYNSKRRLKIKLQMSVIL